MVDALVCIPTQSRLSTQGTVSGMRDQTEFPLEVGLILVSPALLGGFHFIIRNCFETNAIYVRKTDPVIWKCRSLVHRSCDGRVYLHLKDVQACSSHQLSHLQPLR